MSVSKWSIVLAVVLLTVNACHKRPPAIASTRPPATITAPVPPSSSPRSATAAAAASEAAPLTESQLFERMTLDQLNASQPLNDVFFDYDQNILGDDTRKVLQGNAQWLSKWPQTKIRIDGHCDERGTTEYNLALGRSAGNNGSRLSNEPGNQPRSNSDGESRQRVAFLHVDGRIVLGAEPTRPLRNHGEVSGAGRSARGCLSASSSRRGS